MDETDIGSEVYIDNNEHTIPDAVGEEVVIEDPLGGSGEAVDCYQRQQEAIIEGVDTDNIVQLKEEVFKYADCSEEMSVAIDLAKLSQGHFSHRDIHLKNQRKGKHKLKPESDKDGSEYVIYTENGAQGLEDYEGDSFVKPRMSYAQLIAEALMNAEEGVLTLSEIYQAISNKHPYYRMDSRNWQNSIRHNLTLNKSFSKVPRLTTEGRGSHWKLEPGAEAMIFKRGARAVARVQESSAILTGSDPNQVTGSSNTINQIIYVTIPSS